MNRHPEQYEVLGDVELDIVVVMTRPQGDFRVRLDFKGITCDGVTEATPATTRSRTSPPTAAPIEVWQAMFDDIVANGRATGRQTLNALTLWAEDMSIVGPDPMDTDRVPRFNQTLQQFLDGAAHLDAVETPAWRRGPPPRGRRRTHPPAPVAASPWPACSTSPTATGSGTASATS